MNKQGTITRSKVRLVANGCNKE